MKSASKSSSRPAAKQRPKRAAKSRAEIVDGSGGAPRLPTMPFKRARGPDHAIELGILDGFIGFHLRQAQDAALRSFIRYPGLKNFQPGRFAVMMIIYYNPGISQGALARVIARDKSTLTPIIQDLQRRGFIERRKSAHDRRSIRLSLAPRGQKALSKLLRHVYEHDRALDSIVGDEKPALLALLRKLTDALRDPTG